MRCMLLRDVSEAGFLLFASDPSPKLDALRETGEWELLVFWPSLMQQYRIRGSVSMVNGDLIRKHWKTKSYSAKILDQYYFDRRSQSQEIESRSEFVREIKELKKQFPQEKQISCQNNIQGLLFQPDYVEIWTGSMRDRLHERVLYEHSEGQWTKSELIP